MHRPITSALANAAVPSPRWTNQLGRLRYQLLFGILLCVALPAAAYHGGDIHELIRNRSTVDTATGCVLAYILSIVLYRRMSVFPGFHALGHLLSSIVSSYGLVLVAIFTFRIEYSRLNFGISFVTALTFLGLTVALFGRRDRQPFYVLPFGEAMVVTRIPGFDWRVMDAPHIPADENAILIADLRADLQPDWERAIADAALKGRPVYHFKQVEESITGRVQIHHLSENSFGSLIPNLGYRKIKRALDVLVTLALIPLLAPPMLVVALLIKMDSPGPAFFRQERRGYRGEVFEVLKFRTMAHGEPSSSDQRDHAITRSSDERITRLGAFLRRTRIDELPQMWNVLRGEMSWIGPRPEAMALSEWYMAELPYYSYRHIVRPGITGWAQVNQGHVAELERVHQKLHYDFFYIKNYSAWLDLLIVYRTISTVISGHGSK